VKKLQKTEKPKIKNLPTPNIKKIHHFRLDKDGTYYDVLVFEINGSFGNVEVGHQENGLLVIGGDRKAYQFRKNSYCATGYIYEKLCYPNFSMKDAENIRLALVEKGLVK
jgi:hypothetical protein